jgi:hypothetical protein
VVAIDLGHPDLEALSIDLKAIVHLLPSIGTITLAAHAALKGLKPQANPVGKTICTALIDTCAHTLRRLELMEGARALFSDAQIGTLIRACANVHSVRFSPHFLCCAHQVSSTEEADAVHVSLDLCDVASPPPCWPSFPEIILHAPAGHPAPALTHISVSLGGLPPPALAHLLMHLQRGAPGLTHLAMRAPPAPMEALLARCVPASIEHLSISLDEDLARGGGASPWDVVVALLDLGYRGVCGRLRSISFEQAEVARRVRDAFGKAPGLSAYMVSGVAFDLLDDVGAKISSVGVTV